MDNYKEYSYMQLCLRYDRLNRLFLNGSVTNLAEVKAEIKEIGTILDNWKGEKK